MMGSMILLEWWIDGVQDHHQALVDRETACAIYSMLRRMLVEPGDRLRMTAHTLSGVALEPERGFCL
jgi:hypothetical protein